MAIIDLEFIEATFVDMLWALIAHDAAVPVPTLDVLGAERLIAWLEWPVEPQLESTPPAGVVVRPGELLYRLAFQLRHVSVPELLADPSTSSISSSGHAWFRLGVPTDPWHGGPSEPRTASLIVEGVACALNGRPAAHIPQTWIKIPMPRLPAPIVNTAVVRMARGLR